LRRIALGLLFDSQIDGFGHQPFSQNRADAARGKSINQAQFEQCAGFHLVIEDLKLQLLFAAPLQRTQPPQVGQVAAFLAFVEAVDTCRNAQVRIDAEFYRLTPSVSLALRSVRSGAPQSSAMVGDNVPWSFLPKPMW
jgi:hypothetical protein